MIDELKSRVAAVQAMSPSEINDLINSQRFLPCPAAWSSTYVNAMDLFAERRVINRVVYMGCDPYDLTICLLFNGRCWECFYHKPDDAEIWDRWFSAEGDTLMVAVARCVALSTLPTDAEFWQ